MSKKILVVDDEKSLARALELKLKHEGLEITIAYNGIEALNAIKKEDFDFILLDLVMPGLDGFEVLEKLNQRKEKMPIVVVTSNLSQKEDIDKVLKLGAKDYFIKSNTPLSKIVSCIKESLNIS